MQICHIAGYKFINLSDLPALQASLAAKCDSEQLKGTILLSHEGININLSGFRANIDSFKTFLWAQPNFADISFRESESDALAFKRMRVKIKKEIITFGQSNVQPETHPAPHISPQELKQWLDENRDFTLLDTRNEYEIRFGSFKGALNLHINDFSEFPNAAKQLPKNKPIVMYCTGGIRCEKAGLHLLNENFPEVYQLEGGILQYFADIGDAHFEGDCFVFDERIALDAALKITNQQVCRICSNPLSHIENNHLVCCQPCINNLT